MFHNNNPEPADAQRNAPQKIAENGKEAQSLWVPTDSVGLYTLVLALFTALLVGVSGLQGWFLLRADKTALKAANAAELNAEALISVERAQLFVIVRHSNLFDVLRGPRFYRETESMNGAFIPRAELEFVIRNTGRTAAILQDVSYQFVQADAETTMWQYSYRDTIVNAVIEGGNETSPATPCVMEETLTLGDGIAIIDGERPLYFYGFVIFRDTFKNRHQYFWRHEYRGNRFVLVHEEERPAEM
jgi:hypothetical protein